jgi:hypothetical protein
MFSFVGNYNHEAGVGNGPLRELLAVFASGLFCADSPLFEPTPDGNSWHIRAHFRAEYLYEHQQHHSNELPCQYPLTIPSLLLI